MSSARETILARLHASGAEATSVPDAAPPADLDLSREEKIGRLVELMTAMRAEVHVVEKGGWQEKLAEVARERGWKRLLYGPESPIGKELDASWSAEGDGLPQRVVYVQEVETFKSELFETIDVGLTGSCGAVADTGAVAICPSVDEPRLISLVPPVHVAVLDADTIYNSLGELMAAQNWVEGMPTNALLISGPSKTADIEFTLVFGVHGPKELVLLIKK